MLCQVFFLAVAKSTKNLLGVPTARDPNHSFLPSRAERVRRGMLSVGLIVVQQPNALANDAIWF